MLDPVEQARVNVNQNFLSDEAELIWQLKTLLHDYQPEQIHQNAYQLVSAVRLTPSRRSLVESFLQEYQLNSKEGIILLCIAEALLRIPDHHTQDTFLQEKLTEADWHSHIQHSDSMWVNWSTQLLQFSGDFQQQFALSHPDNLKIFSDLKSRVGTPFIRNVLKHAMQFIANQFILGETIEHAFQQAKHDHDANYSFDMLGEAALTASDAQKFYQSYAHAIDFLATQNKSEHNNTRNISIKLSALYPRYEPLKRHQAISEISNKLLNLVKQAKLANVNVTIDAEEVERLDLSLDIFESVYSNPILAGWHGFGLAVQAYQKRALCVLKWLKELSKKHNRIIPIRLVKGAYWDTEIKLAQVRGLRNYPVFTHKTSTDICYLACAQYLISHPEFFYPQFATHNAHTVSAILSFANHHPHYEFQRLHGMGQSLYNELLKNYQRSEWSVRIYAPVGQYNQLLPYLVRRLLENGANSSFINQLDNHDLEIDKIILDPVQVNTVDENLSSSLHLPKHLYDSTRVNSDGLNLADPQELDHIVDSLKKISHRYWLATPLIDGIAIQGKKQPITNPANNEKIGDYVESDAQTVIEAIDAANFAFNEWRLVNVKQRAEYLQQASYLLEYNKYKLCALCIQEGGKTMPDALTEIREAIDYCRYYAYLAKKAFDQPTQLSGPTGEENLLHYYGRGVFVCISPWNFPVAIFIGQIAAALVSGNTVIAKPANQTPLTAMLCIQLLHKAGIPSNVLHFLPGDGARIGQTLLSDPRIAGVAFTGSTQTAQLIHRQLSQLPSIIPLIAETGGINAMIADNSAHTEQLVQDVTQSAFNSAGQRCSSLRVLFLPDETANTVIEKLIEVMQLLEIDDPLKIHTDIGPLINQQAVEKLQIHVDLMKEKAKVLYQTSLSTNLKNQPFFPPTLIELSSIEQLKQETFGPILHIVRYQSNQLEQVIQAINNTGYGLTLGIHSRINKTINKIVENARIGNIYINRHMISAVVGEQPFGGMGLSGTGPKAGGPNYLLRFCNEQTTCKNTAAIGGNTRLLSQNRV